MTKITPSLRDILEKAAKVIQNAPAFIQDHDIDKVIEDFCILNDHCVMAKTLGHTDGVLAFGLAASWFACRILEWEEKQQNG